MATIKSKYLGELRTESVHVKSDNKIITDAPLDNNGKGEAFSPTDLLCSALGSCMMTIIGILARREEIDLTSVTYEITKVMSANPRKVSEIHINFDMKGVKASDIQVEKLKRAASTCPVALSLDPSVKQIVDFKFN
ncbi:MAG TPA: OsmC family protein [Cytophagales bacterium]|nr:OsmC family protein [Cytophagales bacterium]